MSGTINLTELINEIIKEEKLIFNCDENGVDEKDKYYDKVKRRFERVLEIANINKNKIKIGKEYAIPIDDKELIKQLILEANSKYAKGLRLGNPSKYSQEDRFEFLLAVEKRLESKYKGEELIRQKEKFYAYSNILSEYKAYSIRRTLEEFTILAVEKRLESKYKGEELIRQKEKFYAYSNILSEYKAYSIRRTLEEFTKIEFKKLQIQEHRSRKLTRDEEDILWYQKEKIKALHNNNLKEYYKLDEMIEEKLGDTSYGYNTVTENDRVLILDMYERMIKVVLNDMKVFAQKFSEVRQYKGKDMSFINALSEGVFEQAINDFFIDRIIHKDEMPEACKKSVEELLKNRDETIKSLKLSEGVFEQAINDFFIDRIIHKDEMPEACKKSVEELLKNRDETIKSLKDNRK